MNIVIVGGGFAGIKAALEIAKYNFAKVKLISDESYFLYHATLYSTATGGNKAESVVPLVDIFAGVANVDVVRDKISSLDNTRKLVVGDKASYKYDKLIIAIGNVTSFCNIEGMKEHAFGVKTLADIKKFSQHIVDEVIENNHLDRNYYVVGAGPTGTELAASLAQYLEHLVYVHKNTKGKIRVTLVEAADRILPGLSVRASEIITKRLKDLGVNVLTGSRVEAVQGSHITIDGKTTPTETVIWTSGVANNPFFKKHDHIFHFDEHGRVNVDDHLEASDDIYVIGDNNSVQYGGTAWPAVRQGEFIAKHLHRLHKGLPTRRFRPIKPSDNMAVGRDWGYFEWFGVRVYGLIGYKVRRFIEYLGYRAILPRAMALTVWRSHYLKEIHTK